MTDLSEAALVAKARRGDTDAFEALTRRYEKRVYALALRMCGNPDFAWDAAQEALLSAWQSLPSFRGESSFSTWLYRLTTTASIDLLRRENRQKALPLDDADLNLDLPDRGPGPEEAAERGELRRLIEEGLQSLPDEYRAALTLRELHQLSYQEIADALAVDLGTVKSRISRGRKLLRNFLLRHGNFLAASPSKTAGKGGCK